MKEKSRIAGVLACNPEVVVLTSQLCHGPPARRNLAITLQELPQAKIVITHDTQFASLVATRGLFFQSGKIAAQGPVGDLVAKFDWSGF